LSAGASAAPAGLTARARPEARPEGRAANLREWTLYDKISALQLVFVSVAGGWRSGRIGGGIAARGPNTICAVNDESDLDSLRQRALAANAKRRQEEARAKARPKQRHQRGPRDAELKQAIISKSHKLVAQDPRSFD
jgi:hypothetical protein